MGTVGQPVPVLVAALMVGATYAVQDLEVGDQVVVVEVMGSGQRSILRCEAANTAAGTSTILAK